MKRDFCGQGAVEHLADLRSPVRAQLRAAGVEFRPKPVDPLREGPAGVQRHPVADRGARRRRAMHPRAPGQIQPFRRQRTGEDLLVALRPRGAEKEFMQRRRGALRRHIRALTFGRADALEGGGEELLLIGRQAVEIRREMAPLAKGRRLGDRIAERGGRGVDETTIACAPCLTCASVKTRTSCAPSSRR